MTSLNQSAREKDTLGARIARHRRRLGLTQEELSQLLGVTAQAVSKWENDASCPDIMLLPRLGEILGITTDELLGVRPAEAASEPAAEPVPPPVNMGKLKFRIHITDPRGKNTNVTLPMSFVMRVADTGIKISGVLGGSAVNDLQLRQILDLVKGGVTGEVLDFTSDDGTNIKIEIS